MILSVQKFLDVVDILKNYTIRHLRRKLISNETEKICLVNFVVYVHIVNRKRKFFKFFN